MQVLINDVILLKQRVMISATPVPFMLELVSNGVETDRIEFFNLDPSTNYVGIEDLKQMVVDGKPVCLEHDELARSSGKILVT